MAKKNKITLQFKGFEEYAERLDKLGGDLKATTEKALQKSYDVVTPKLKDAIRKHHRSGLTENSLKTDSKVKWNGTFASIDVGFKISDGGFPSIFLMYGTPRMKKDQKLYNSIYGSKTKKEIAEIQEEIFAEEIRKIMGG